MIPVTHAFTSPVIDEHNPNEVGPDERNAAHQAQDEEEAIIRLLLLE
jgi:hypothetical protein